MISPDDLSLMSEQEKLELLRRISDTDEWQDCFEPLYRKLMDDESPKVREEAVAALWSLADFRHIEPLMQKVEGDPDVRVRGRAASVLGIYICEDAGGGSVDEAQYLAVRKFLLDAAENDREDMFVRRMAIEALAFDADEAVHDLIEWAYQQPSVEMKMSAIFAMGRSQSPRWSETILAELDSKEKRLQLEAINATATAGLTEATPRLRNLARSKDKEMRLATLWALAHAGGPGALETLEMCAQSKDQQFRDAAAEAIEEFEQLRRGEEESDDFEGDGQEK